MATGEPVAFSFAVCPVTLNEQGSRTWTRCVSSRLWLLATPTYFASWEASTILPRGWVSGVQQRALAGRVCRQKLMHLPWKVGLLALPYLLLG